jgi:hypothetical protein
MVIGHADLVACDWIGDADASGPRTWQSGFTQIGFDGPVDGDMVGAGQHLNVAQSIACCSLPAETGVGTTYIAEQSRKQVSSGHGKQTATELKK